MKRYMSTALTCGRVKDFQRVILEVYMYPQVMV